MPIGSDDIAKICHSANSALRIALGQGAIPSWHDRSPAQRAGMIAAVENALADPAATAEGNHLRWLETHEREGWTWGPKEDRGARVHPSLRPWGELPAEERAKGELFLSVVRSLAPLTYAAAAKAVAEAAGG